MSARRDGAETGRQVCIGQGAMHVAQCSQKRLLASGSYPAMLTAGQESLMFPLYGVVNSRSNIWSNLVLCHSSEWWPLPLVGRVGRDTSKSNMSSHHSVLYK